MWGDREVDAFVNSYEDVGLVMPKVLYPNGELQYLCKLLPTPFDLLGRRFLPSVKNILDIEMKDMNYGFWDMIRRWKFLHCPVALCSYEFLY